MTTKTGVASVDPVPAATNDGNTPLRQIPGVPSAAPSRSHAGSAAVPLLSGIELTVGEYRIAATRFGRRLAGAVRTAHGWHLAYLGPGKRPEWQTYDDTQSAAEGVYTLAVQRAHSRSN